MRSRACESEERAWKSSYRIWYHFGNCINRPAHAFVLVDLGTKIILFSVSLMALGLFLLLIGGPVPSSVLSASSTAASSTATFDAVMESLAGFGLAGVGLVLEIMALFWSRADARRGAASS
jgi:hypothetical protein